MTGQAGHKKKGKAKPKAKARSSRKPTEPYKRPDWADKWLEAFANEGTVSEACRVAKVGRSTVYDLRQRDEAFALEWHDIEEETTEIMEREAFRRGVEGVERPVIHKGEDTGLRIREYSDTLLIFMLKGRKPETYRDRVDHRHSGKVETPGGGLDLSKLDDDQVDQLEELLAKARTSPAGPR